MNFFQAYVVFAQTLGNVWIERNLSVFLAHVLDLAANPKAASSHVDAVYSRKCINFILRSVLGRMLGEKAQASACKEITFVIAKQMNSIGKKIKNILIDSILWPICKMLAKIDILPRIFAWGLKSNGIMS